MSARIERIFRIKRIFHVKKMKEFLLKIKSKICEKKHISYTINELSCSYYYNYLKGIICSIHLYSFS